MTTWAFEIEEFAALWYGPAADRMLFPLHYLSRFSHMNQLEQFRADVRREWSEQGRLDWDAAEQLDRTFAVLTAPEAWVEVHGYDKRGPLRAIAARHDQHAAVVRQSSDGGKVRVGLVGADRLAHSVATALPDTPAGTRPVERFDERDLRPSDPTVVTIIEGTNPRDRYRRWREEPCSSAGLIQVFRGPRSTQGKPPPRIATVQWHDRPDGRYVETGSRARTVAPANASTVAHLVAREVDRALDEYREYNEDMSRFTR
ncbi:ESX secretion-associated protein EspG [Nocardia sp. NPDC056064]|uniref:ESX secretion-associated protein EspG n=1 Tax=Nocardia sp. NPDC056064 TaxID=3345701 RepID=UPI0035D65902